MKNILVKASLTMLIAVQVSVAATSAPATAKNKKHPATPPAKTKSPQAKVSKPSHPSQSLPSKSKTAVASTSNSNRSKSSQPPARPTVAVKQRTGMEWVRTLPTWIYPIKVSVNQSSSQLYETRGLAVEGVYMLVPLDSVFTAWLSRSDLRFFVNGSVEARVADLDLAASIAILKLDSPMPAYLNRSQIRTDIPSMGEALAAVESRESIHGGPRFLGLVRDGESTRYNILRNNTLTSGGFIFDRAGNLVSMVPSLQNPQNPKTWASSTQSIVELIHRQDGPKPASVSGVEERHNQLVSWQERWTRSFIPTQKSFSTQNLDCRTNLASISEASVASKIRQMNSMDCETQTSLPLGGGYNAGLEVKTGNIVLRTPSLSDVEGLKLATTFGTDYFDDLAKRSTQVNLLTVSDCQENKVVNQKGHPVHVKFCTSAFKSDKGLSDTVIALSSVDAGSHAYVLAAHLKGFDQNNTKKVIEALIENGESLK